MKKVKRALCTDRAFLRFVLFHRYLTCIVFSAFMLHGQTIQSTIDPLLRCESWVVQQSDSIYSLQERFINPFSIQVGIDMKPQHSPDDFVLNAALGRIRFVHPPDSGSTIKVCYRRLPVNLSLSYSRVTSADTSGMPFQEIRSSAARRKQPTDSPAWDSDAQLQRSGSIFRGVTVGTNQGMRLQSGLRLQISGQITPGVEVTASLTDQNTPIQPEGNTQTLQEIDKVFVDIQAKSVKLTLGDFMADTGPSGFGTYSRKLQGAMGTVHGDWGEMTLIGAASRGQFTSRTIQGIEGNQGPYQLTGALGQRDIIVLAGTERVWIDGEPMVRGEDNDYVIEYGLGQITFTRNRLVTSDSRITVDFEYSDQRFNKSIYGAQGALKFWKDRLEIRTSFLRESDDKENPLDYVLTDKYRDVLGAAGDNPDSAVVSGAQYVGKGQGAYVRVDTLGGLTYRHVGDKTGDHHVRFAYVGPNKGDYSFQGYGIYRYEGTGRGSYLPVLFLPLAQMHQAVNLISELTVSERVALSAEIAFSDEDLNQYSRRDDADNAGMAAQTELKLKGQPLLLGEMDFSAKIREVDHRFRPVGRMADVEYGRRWGTEEGVFWGESVREAEGEYRPWKTLRIGGELGDFQRGEFYSNRKMMFADFKAKQDHAVYYRRERIESDHVLRGTGFWLRQRGSARTRLWAFRPGVLYEGEHRKNEDSDSLWTGLAFDDWTGELALDAGRSAISYSTSFRERKQVLQGRMQKESESKTQQIRWEFNGGSRFNAAVLFTRRNRDYVNPAIEDKRTNLADVRLKFSPDARILNGTFNYQFSSTQVSELVRDTIKVGAGRGNYRFDEALQELVPDADGDLWIRMIQTGNFTPANDLKSGLELRWDGSRIASKRKWISPLIRSLRARTVIRLERRDSERDFTGVNRSAFSPQWGADSTIVYGRMSVFQDVHILPDGGRLQIRLKLRRDDSENNQLVYEGLVRHVNDREIQVKGMPSVKLGLLAEYQHKTDEKIYHSKTGANRDIALHHWTGEISYRPKQQIEFALKARYRQGEDPVTDPGIRAWALFVLPRVTYAFRGRGNLRAEFEYGHIHAGDDVATVPYEMFNGDQPGRTIRWNMLMTYRLSGHVMGTLNYRARKEPWRDRLYQTGQVEVRAFF